MLVAENIEEHKSKLKFFMQRFCGIIKTMDSTHKELSIAIRGYGFFAAVCMFTNCSIWTHKDEIYTTGYVHK